MNFYVKKLYPNELGIRNGIPNKAGKLNAVFLLVPVLSQKKLVEHACI